VDLRGADRTGSRGAGTGIDRGDAGGPDVAGSDVAVAGPGAVDPDVVRELRSRVPTWRERLSEHARAADRPDPVAAAYATIIRRVALRCLEVRGHLRGGRGARGLLSALDRLAPAGSPRAGSARAPAELDAELREMPPHVFAADELLGRVHEAFHDEDRTGVFTRSKRRGGKVEAADLPAATQVFTEPEMATFLLHNALGARWRGTHPESEVVRGWRHVVVDAAPVDGGAAPRRPAPLRDWRILDPAVGAGNVLFAAFDLLVALYAEERRLAAAGELPASWPVPAEAVAATILGRNLAGIDIDRRPVRLAALVLAMKAIEHGAGTVPRMDLVAADVAPGRGAAFAGLVRRHRDTAVCDAIEAIWSRLETAPVLGCLVRPEADAAAAGLTGTDVRALLDEVATAAGAELTRTDDVAAELFGAPPPDRLRLLELLGRRYDVVATNPPFVGFRVLAPEVKDAVTALDPLARQDLYVAVLNRAWELLAEEGTGAWVSPENWCNASRLTAVRRLILEEGGPRVIASLGTGAFDGILSHIALSVVEKGRRPTTTAVVVDDLDAPPRHYPTGLLAEQEHAPFVLRMPPSMLASRHAGTPVGGGFAPRDGLWSGDNARDARFWWEVDLADDRWVPAATGRYGRWYAPIESVYRVSSVGEGEVERLLAHRNEGFGYLRVAFGRLCARVVAPGTAALAGVVSFAPAPDRASEPPVLEALAVFNSRIGTAWLRDLVTGINFNAGYARMVPIPRDEQLAAPVRRAVAAKRALADADPTSWDFRDVPPPSDAAVTRRRELEAELLEAEGEVERRLIASFGLDRDACAYIDGTFGLPAAWYPEGRRERSGRGDRSLPAETELERACHAARAHPRTVLASLERRASTDALSELAEDRLSVLVLRVLGHRWPRQDAYEAERGAPFLAPEHVVGSGIVPLMGGMGAPTLAQRVRGLATDVDELEAALGVDLESWLATRFFPCHVARFRRRPVVWQLTSPGGGVGVVVHHRRLDRAGLRALRDGPVATLLASGEHRAEATAFDEALARLEAGTDPASRISCPWRRPRRGGWDPDPDDGIRVNIAPVQRVGLLPGQVLTQKDLDEMRPAAGGGTRDRR
jgi:hypothetical protein